MNKYGARRTEGVHSILFRSKLEADFAQQLGKPPIPLEAKTRWGRVVAIGFIGGERYYWMISRWGTVSMMPAFVVEEEGAP
jgi:hypothetical protein